MESHTQGNLQRGIRPPRRPAHPSARAEHVPSLLHALASRAHFQAGWNRRLRRRRIKGNEQSLAVRRESGGQMRPSVGAPMSQARRSRSKRARRRRSPRQLLRPANKVNASRLIRTSAAIVGLALCSVAVSTAEAPDRSAEASTTALRPLQELARQVLTPRGHASADAREGRALRAQLAALRDALDALETDPSSDRVAALLSQRTASDRAFAGFASSGAHIPKGAQKK